MPIDCQKVRLRQNLQQVLLLQRPNRHTQIEIRPKDEDVHQVTQTKHSGTPFQPIPNATRNQIGRIRIRATLHLSRNRTKTPRYRSVLLRGYDGWGVAGTGT